MNDFLLPTSSIRPLSLWARVLLLAAVLLFGIYALDATVNARGFYADGAFFYVDVLSQHTSFNYFDDSKHIRLFINVINQLPLIVCTKLGVVAPSWLHVAFNAPLFFGNALLLLLLWWLSCRHGFRLIAFWATVSWVATVLPSDIFAINQARLAQTMYWLLLFFALTPKQLSRKEVALLLALSLVSFRSHESIIFFGPVMSAAAWLASRQSGVNRGVRHGLMVLGAVWVVWGLYWQLSHPVRSGTIGFLGSVLYWRLSDIVWSTMFFGWSLVALLGWWLWAQWRHQSVGPVARWWGHVYPMVCLLIGITPLWWPGQVWMPAEYAFRFFIPFGGAALAAVAVMDQYKGLSRGLDRSMVTVWVASALIGMSVWQICSTRLWVSFTNDVRQSAAQATVGLPVVSVESALSRLPSERQHIWRSYQWGWAMPAMSLAVQTQPVVHALIGPQDNQEEFYFEMTSQQLHIPFKPVTDKYFDVQPLAKACAEAVLVASPNAFCR